MDTHFVKLAEEQYRAKTGETRPWESLPPSVQSAIMTAAQKLKSDAATKEQASTSVTTSLGSVVGTSKWRLL